VCAVIQNRLDDLVKNNQTLNACESMSELDLHNFMMLTFKGISDLKGFASCPSLTFCGRNFTEIINGKNWHFNSLGPKIALNYKLELQHRKFLKFKYTIYCMTIGIAF